MSSHTCRGWRRWPLLAALFCTWQASAAPPSVTDGTPLIAIIIDDLGDNLEQGLRSVRLPAPVAMAFLPHTQYARPLAQVAHHRDKEVMLHLPMQATDGAAPGPGAITAAMTEANILATLDRDLAALPHVVGINNHMGSLITADGERMHWLMQGIGRRGTLFFVDSRTTAATVAQQAATEMGVPNLRRNVFLDDDINPAAIAAEFARLLNLARKQGTALAIGHPHSATLALLERRLPQLAAEGVAIVPVRTLLQRQQQATAKLYAAVTDKTTITTSAE